MAGLVVLLSLLAAIFTTVEAKHRIWSFAIGEEYGAHEYINDDDESHSGFGLELIDLVCASGNMDCRIIRDRYENCWDHIAPEQRAVGGKGLMSGWYDACTGWVPTMERIHTFDFTIPYIRADDTFFFVLKGRKASFNPQDMLNKKIAFIDGWASNPKCLSRQNSKIKNLPLTESQIKLFTTPKDIIQGLQRGEADASFSALPSWSEEQLALLDKFEFPMKCSLDGTSLMIRKDNPVTGLWNNAFQKLREGRKFNKFCEAQNIKHGHKGRIDCIEF